MSWFVFTLTKALLVSIYRSSRVVRASKLRLVKAIILSILRLSTVVSWFAFILAKNGAEDKSKLPSTLTSFGKLRLLRA